MSTNSVLFDKSVRHAVFLERLKLDQVSGITKVLEETLIDVKATIEKRLIGVKGGMVLSSRTTQRLKDLYVATDAQLKVAYNVIHDKFGVDLKQLSGIEADFQTKALRDAVPIDFDFVSPAPATLRSLVTSRPFQGKLLKNWFSTLELQTKDNVRQAVTQGMIQGETISAIARRMKNVTGASTRAATTVARTAVNHVSTHAREEVYAENSELIKGVQYVATLDTRTTEICMSLDGKVFPIGEGERPPVHLQCRSTTVPVVRSLKELGLSDKEFSASTRASMNGQVPEKTTYPQWLKKQSNAIQNEALGVGKAKLFRAGKLDIGKFNGAGSRALTLDQLKAKDVSKPRPKVKAKPTVEKAPKIGVPKSEETHREFIQRFSKETENAPMLDKIARAKHLDRRMQKILDLDELKTINKRTVEYQQVTTAYDKFKTTELVTNKHARSVKSLSSSTKLNTQQRSAVSKLLNKEIGGDGIHLTVDRNSKQVGAYGKRQKEAEEWLSRSKAKTRQKSMFLRTKKLNAGSRSYSSESNIFLAADESAAGHVHEMGHVMELDFDVKAAVQKFRIERSRLVSSNRRSFHKFDDVLGSGYGDGEVGKLIDFDRAFGTDGWYVGKNYKTGGSELVSMGVELMFKNPIHFIQSDPEFAKFILGILDGSLL